MKKAKTLLLLVVLALVSSHALVHAVPVGSSNESRDYLIAARDLSNWSCGTTLNMRERDITAFGSGAVTMDTQGMLGFLGYDVARWITLYLIGGASQHRIVGESVPGGAEYGLGLHFNIFDHDIMDPTLFEDRLRLNASCHAVYTECAFRGVAGVQAMDTYAALTGSIVNDLPGHKFFVPRSIAIYAGPTYSSLQNFDRTVRTLTPFGATAGLEFYWGPHFAWHVGANTYNGTVSPSSGMNIRF